MLTVRASLESQEAQAQYVSYVLLSYCVTESTYVGRLDFVWTRTVPAFHEVGVTVTIETACKEQLARI